MPAHTYHPKDTLSGFQRLLHSRQLVSCTGKEEVFRLSLRLTTSLGQRKGKMNNIQDLLNAADVTESIYSFLTKSPIDISAKSEPATAFKQGKGQAEGVEEWIFDSSDKENRDYQNLNLNYRKREFNYSANALTADNPRLQRLSTRATKSRARLCRM